MTAAIKATRAAGYKLLGKLAEVMNITAHLGHLTEYPLVVANLQKLRGIVISHISDIGDPERWHTFEDVPNLDRLHVVDSIEELNRHPAKHEALLAQLAAEAAAANEILFGKGAA
ncbi:MAG TPA: hypothetical protein PKV97_01835 [Thauera aminoaromatica]|nr:hypothetical protein [Thauera aminoaromatica]